MKLSIRLEAIPEIIAITNDVMKTGTSVVNNETSSTTPNSAQVMRHVRVNKLITAIFNNNFSMYI